jgi:hypothetical protein
MTLEDCVNSRIRYLEALPRTARDVWIAASYELWAREAFPIEEDAESDRVKRVPDQKPFAFPD